MELAKNYAGFDGVSWPNLECSPHEGSDVPAPLNQFSLVERYFSSLSTGSGARLIALTEPSSSGAGLPENWRLLGFDAGWYRASYSHFSLILNEVICGRYNELITFRNRLNEHSLFSELKMVEELVAAHDAMERAGADVEHSPAPGSLGGFAIFSDGALLR
jgi:hypothetical protein